MCIRDSKCQDQERPLNSVLKLQGKSNLVMFTLRTSNIVLRMCWSLSTCIHRQDTTTPAWYRRVCSDAHRHILCNTWMCHLKCCSLLQVVFPPVAFNYCRQSRILWHRLTWLYTVSSTQIMEVCFDNSDLSLLSFSAHLILIWFVSFV